MTIIGDKVILRDFLPEDIPKRIEWETVETEWQSWDAPWEYDGLTAEEKQADLNRYGENMRRWAQQPPLENERRTEFQICLNTKEREYIGWCSAYRIDEAFRFARDGCYCAVGIDLPERLGFRECHREMGVRNVKGKAYDALSFRLEPSTERN